MTGRQDTAVNSYQTVIGIATKNKYFKMTGFELFFRADNFNLGAPLLPTFPPSEKCKKTKTKFFHRLQKIENKIKMQKLLNRALATMAKSVRTHFEDLWKRNQRVLLLERLMLCSASQQKTTILK